MILIRKVVEMADVYEVFQKYYDRLQSIPGVVGVFVNSKERCIVVYVEREDVDVPQSIEGVLVKKVVLGEEVRAW